MEVLWLLGEARVSDLVEALDQDPKPAYTTVSTMLRVLEKRAVWAIDKTGALMCLFRSFSAVMRNRMRCSLCSTGSSTTRPVYWCRILPTRQT